DPSRTPFHWDSSPLAGFTTGKPWLPLASGHATCNVEVLRQDAASILTLHRRLIRERKSRRSLSIGSLRLIEVADHLLVYERQHLDERLLVALNFSQEDAQPLSKDLAGSEIVLSTYLDREGPLDDLRLRAGEG